MTDVMSHGGVSADVVEIPTSHTGFITDIAFDYYGSLFASCSADGFVRIGDARNNTELSARMLHKGPVHAIKWLPATFGPCIVTGGYDRMVCVWKYVQSTGALDLLYYDNSHGGAVTSVDVLECTDSATGGKSCQIVSGSLDGSLCLHRFDQASAGWSKRTLVKQAHRMGVLGVSFVSFSDRATYVVSSGVDGRVSLWDTNASGSIESEFQPPVASEKIAELVKDRSSSTPLVLITRDVASNGGKLIAVAASGDVTALANGAGSENASGSSGSNWSGLVIYEVGGVESKSQNLATSPNSATASSRNAAPTQISIKAVAVIPLESAAMRVAWSVTGSLVAVALSNGESRIFAEDSKGHWDLYDNVLKQREVETGASSGLGSAGLGSSSPASDFRLGGSSSPNHAPNSTDLPDFGQASAALTEYASNFANSAPDANSMHGQAQQHAQNHSTNIVDDILGNDSGLMI